MTQTLASNMPQGVQIAAAATAKKTKKTTAAAVLADIFSQLPHQGKAAGKSGNISFKSILEPAKASKLKNTAEPNDKPFDKTLKKSEKNKTENSGDNVIIPSGDKSKIYQGAGVSSAQNDSAKYESHNETHSQKAEQANSGIKPTIEPRSPMHGKILGKNDSGRTLITDGPKAKKHGVTETVEQPITENLRFSKSEKINETSAEFKAASDKLQVSSIANKVQTGSVQNVPVPQETSTRVLENKTKAPATKTATANAEKVRVKYESLNRESNSRSFAEKQAKSGLPGPEIMRNMQIQESNSIGIASASVKSELNIGTASEQLVPPSIGSTSASNTNNTVITTKSTATVYDQVISAATAASYKIGQKIAVNLNPPELGRISIRFEKSGDEVIGRIEVERSETKNQIDLNLAQIVQNLQDSGVQLKHFEVILREQPFEHQKEFSSNTQQDWNTKQQFTPDKNDSGLISAVEHISYPQTIGTYPDNKSVNILI